MKGVYKCKCPNCGHEYTINVPVTMMDGFVEKCPNPKCRYIAPITNFVEGISK